MSGGLLVRIGGNDLQAQFTLPEGLRPPDNSTNKQTHTQLHRRCSQHST